MKIYFIGIGGIGVSALAQYYLAKGNNVFGFDLQESKITKSLEKMGVFLKKDLLGEKELKSFDLLIYSPAVEKNHPILKTAKKLKIKTLSYPQALGELTKEYYTIAVSGTHGKSTTTAMASLVLIKAGLDPTVIIGTKLKEFGDTNCRIGKSKLLLIEADEHFASFLNYRPNMILLTNIEADHLDFYGSLANLLKTFKKYISFLGEKGVLILNQDDKNIKKIIKKKEPFSIREYNLKQKEAKLVKKALNVPGEHNIYNALAVLTMARELKIPDKITLKSLLEFKGAWRRFEIIQEKPFVLISDYGHNPTKMISGLRAAREKYPKKKIWCIYQPHQKERTKYLFKEFVNNFRLAPTDKIIITEIYDVAGREDSETKVSSQELVKKINRNNIIYIKKDSLLNYLKENIKKGMVLIIMGAGDIYLLVDDLRLTLAKKRKKIH